MLRLIWILKHRTCITAHQIYVSFLPLKRTRLRDRDVVTFLKLDVPQRSRAHFAIKTGFAHLGFYSLSGPKTGCAQAHHALKVTTPCDNEEIPLPFIE